MQKAPVMKSSGLAPIDDEPVHVFGRNLADRVVEAQPEDEEQKKRDETEREKREQEDDVETIKKRKFETITGEEDEDTAFQGDFKLFVWDKSTSNWTEKGRGQLKLNDSTGDGHKSRLIMRAGGTYRIILNVAIQHSFFKVIAITKTSIRFTDSQNVWAASGSNAKQLGDLIADRLEMAAEQEKSCSSEGDKQDDSSVEPPTDQTEDTEERTHTTQDEAEAEAVDEKNNEKEETDTDDQRSEESGEQHTDENGERPIEKTDTEQGEVADKKHEDETDKPNEDVNDEKQEKEKEEDDDKQHREDTAKQHEECETKRMKLS